LKTTTPILGQGRSPRGVGRLPCLTLLFSGLLLAGCCEETTVSEAVSEDQQIVAFALQTNCGATTPFHVDVGLRRQDGRQEPGASSWVFSIEGPPAVDLSWTGSRDLLITVLEEGEILERRDRWGDVTIRYRGVSAGAGRDHSRGNVGPAQRGDAPDGALR